MADINKKSIVTGALILTAAGVITRILGFVYRIYMSNVMGAEGMGLYQLIMPVYSLAWSISCSGFNTAVSKLTAQERAKGEYGNMGRVLKQAVLITASLGCLMSLAVYFCALPLSVYFFKDLRTLLPLRILSLAFPFMAAGTCFRGYFIGLQETFVPAINQVLEQFVRMVVVYLLAARFVPRGLNYACAAAVIGLVCEEVFSLLYVLFAYRRFKAKHKLTKRPVFTRRKSLALLLGMALPLTANRVTGSLLSAWENVLIPARLQVFGLSPAEAVSEFGRITGMASPLIFFPTAVLTALSVTLVPAVAEAAATGNAGRRAGTASKAVLFAAIAGFGAASLFV
ncbi:MAG: polysaccharide biosynthesis protein, partial [Clostridiales bacterium]|nr:polysaccharide biosynthesis protein [Clostridiales bacterium]